MTQSATDTQPTKQEFDPESYRMSLGDHLEELRWRLILGIMGFVVAAVVCLIYGERVMAIFCKPLIRGLVKYGQNPSVYMGAITDGFMVYMQVSLICAAALAGPWILYQLWKFVSAGLYPTERKYVTRYMPFSIFLLILGMVFLYFVVLPITINFLIRFSSGVPLLGLEEGVIAPPSTQPAMIIPEMHGDPASPVPNQMWIDTSQYRLKIFFTGASGKGEVRVVPFGPQNLLVPQITLPNYVNLVMQLLIMFGLTFQLPLVVLAVAKMGLVSVATLRKWRRVVYFAISIVCGVVVPDVVTGMIAMMIPLIILYEVGIILAARSIKKAEEEEKAAEGEELKG